MNECKKNILDYLETAYSGAKMMHDEECMIRLSRAILAFKTDPKVDGREFFTEKIFDIPVDGTK